MNCATCHYFGAKDWRCKNAPNEVLLVYYQNSCKGSEWLERIKDQPKDEPKEPTVTPLFGDWE